MVLFIFVTLAIYLSTSTHQVSEAQTLKRVPTSFQDYLDVCIEDTAKEGITILGSQGGYISVPSFIKANDQAFVAYDARGEFGVPAWYYKGEYRIPKLQDLESQISGYVEQNLKTCLNGFEAFSDFDVTEKSLPKATTKITDDTVFVDLAYDLDVTAKGSQVKSYNHFTVTLPVMLGRMYELAKRIVYSEVKNTNFEKQLINLMSASEDVPITGMTFSGRPQTWAVNDVENEVKALIFYNFQNVRFVGTDFLPFERPANVYEKYRGFDLMDYREGRLPADSAPDDAYDYFNLFFDPNNLPGDYSAEQKDFSNIKTAVKFYPNNDFRFVARPSTGNILSSNMAKFPGTDIPFPLQVSHFTYDIDFPLEINLLDSKAFSNEQFVFKFALPVSIRKNKPDKDTPAVTFYEAPVQFDNPCDNVDGSVDIRAVGLFGGLNNMELKDVNVSYDCLKFGCYLGKTKSDGGSYRLVTGIPNSCSGGFINVEKEGYLPAQKQLIDQDSLTIEMKKLKTFTIMVNKRPSYNLGTPQPLDDGDSVIIRIVPYTYSKTIINEFTPETTDMTLDLLADEGKYYLDVMLLDSEKNQVIGGYQGNFTYDYTDTVGRSNLVISVAEFLPRDIPFTPENQLEIMQYIEQGDYREEIQPQFT